MDRAARLGYQQSETELLRSPAPKTSAMLEEKQGKTRSPDLPVEHTHALNSSGAKKKENQALPTILLRYRAQFWTPRRRTA